MEKVGGSEGVYMIDAGSPAHSNWLRWLNCAGNVEQENVVAVSCAGLILYMTTRDIYPGSEMFVWYGDGYGDFLKISRVHPGTETLCPLKMALSILYITQGKDVQFVNVKQNLFICVPLKCY